MPFAARGGPAGPGGYSGDGYIQAPSGVKGPSGSVGSTGSSGSSGSGGTGGYSVGGGVYLGSGSITMYNVTVAYNNTGGGVYQAAGTFNAYNSLFADNGYTQASSGSLGPDGADYSGSGGNATFYNSLLGSFPSGNAINGGGSYVAYAGLAGGLADNGGPTETIALLSTSEAIGIGQNPINGVILFTDQRGYVPTTSSWDAGAYQYDAQAAAAPTATVSAANVPVSGYGQTSYEFSVTYYGAAGLVPGTVAGAVVEVTPPGGGSPIVATVVSSSASMADPFGNEQTITVTYQITPPGGSWTSKDNGIYTIDLEGSPVTDAEGNTIPTGAIGTFQVEVAKIAITKYGLTRNPRTGQWSGTIKLTNTGDATISGPIYVLFNLPAGAILENAAGTYDGMPYIEVNIPSLASGATTSATVAFNSNVSPSSYSTSYYLVSLGS